MDTIAVKLEPREDCSDSEDEDDVPIKVEKSEQEEKDSDVEFVCAGLERIKNEFGSGDRQEYVYFMSDGYATKNGEWFFLTQTHMALIKAILKPRKSDVPTAQEAQDDREAAHQNAKKRKLAYSQFVRAFSDIIDEAQVRDLVIENLRKVPHLSSDDCFPTRRVHFTRVLKSENQLDLMCYVPYLKTQGVTDAELEFFVDHIPQIRNRLNYLILEEKEVFGKFPDNYTGTHDYALHNAARNLCHCLGYPRPLPLTLADRKRAENWVEIMEANHVTVALGRMGRVHTFPEIFQRRAHELAILIAKVRKIRNGRDSRANSLLREIQAELMAIYDVTVRGLDRKRRRFWLVSAPLPNKLTLMLLPLIPR